LEPSQISGNSMMEKSWKDISTDSTAAQRRGLIGRDPFGMDGAMDGSTQAEPSRISRNDFCSRRSG
jgi:hypothetical protein